MDSPIKSGDRCEVISGMGKAKSPNLGLIVTAETIRGEHSQFGRVWRCTGQGIKQLHPDSGEYVLMNWVDFPVAWLRKLPPDPAPSLAKEQEDEQTS